MDKRKIEDPVAIKKFVMAGNAYFTIVSVKTGTRFTYRVNAAEDETKPASHFVALLTEPDNERGYTYLGHIYRRDGVYWHGNKSRVSQDAPSAKAFLWFYDKIIHGQQRPENLGVEIWHEGKCGKCGRRLTVPESIERGIGPECWANHGGM